MMVSGEAQCAALWQSSRLSLHPGAAVKHTAWSYLLMGSAFTIVGVSIVAQGAIVGGIAVSAIGAVLLLVGAARTRSVRRKQQSLLRGRG